MPLAKRGLLVAVLLFGLLSLVATDGDLKVQHDSGVYITLAKSLATGQGYRSIYLAGDPPHTRYPPVFPLLLAPLVGVAGYHFLAMKLLVTAIALLTLYLLYVFFSELANDVMGFLVVIFTATSHGLLFYAQSIMTEIPYLCFSLALGLALGSWPDAAPGVGAHDHGRGRSPDLADLPHAAYRPLLARGNPCLPRLR